MNRQENEPALEYKLRPCGDFIRGTREQLLDLGIGIGQRYPGDPGANKWIVHVQDPRGFDVELERSRIGYFFASVFFPGWPQEPSSCGPAEPFSEGTTRQAFHLSFDAYVGAQDALIAADLVEPDQFPGLPGRLKTCVTIYPSGEVPTSRMGGYSRQADLPGAKRVERLPRGLYRVIVRLPQDEYERRVEAFQKAKELWLNALRALPRPAPLFDLDLLSRQRGRCVAFSPPPGNVISLAAWRERRAR
jgi:hypothetical protein